MTITQHPTTAVPELAAAVPDLDEAWAWYVNTFVEINELAAQRHLMTYAEFEGVFRDPYVLKFYVHDQGRLVGMSVLTRNLEAWPLISPPYFARRWPEFYKRAAIWYVGFVGVTPRHSDGFRRLVTDMYAHVIASNGIAVMDFCSYNVARRRLPVITLKLLACLNPEASMEIADTQSFAVYRFDQAAGV